MSAEIKVSFIKELEQSLCDKVSASSLSSVLSTVSDVLEHYEFLRILRTEESFSLDLFDTWISALKVEGRSPKTIAAYTGEVKKLLRDLNTPIRNITVHHIRSWLTKEKERGLSDTSLENKRQIFSSMFGWLWREGLIEKNPIANIGAIKVQKKVFEPYTDVEIEKLKEVCANARNPLRNTAIISFLLSTGCRVGEVVKINRSDIDFQNKEVIVLGKGNKQRTVFFDDVTAMYLKRYLDSRKDLYPCLFLGQKINALTEGGIRNMLRTRGASAELQKVHPHKFRRTLASTLIAHGMPIQEVASILGHEKLDTTMKYVKLNKNAVRGDYHKYA